MPSFSWNKVGASQEFFFSGKVLSKVAVDLIIAEYTDGLPVPEVSEIPGQVPNWNKHVQNFVKFTIGFNQGYLHDNEAFLLFYPDSMQIKKEVLSFLYNNNLVVKEECTIIISLHLTHPIHNSKRASNLHNFNLCIISSSLSFLAWITFLTIRAYVWYTDSEIQSDRVGLVFLHSFG